MLVAAALLGVLQALPVPPVSSRPVAASAVAKADASPMVCRRIPQIGSMIASKKVCLSRQQWSRSAEDQRAVAERVVLDNAGRPPGGL